MKKGFVLFLLLITKVNASEISKEEIARNIYFGAEILDVKDHSLSMTKMILSRQPSWERHQDLITTKTSKILSSDSYQINVAKVISKHFSIEELLQLQEIMKNPVMLKWFNKTPKFMPELTMVTTDHVMPAINELVTEIRVTENYLSYNEKDKKIWNTFKELFKAQNCSGIHFEADKILKDEPQNIHALYSKGYCYQIENSLNDSLKYFQKVLSINPKYRHTNLNVANVYLMLHEDEKALDYANKEVDLYPQSTDSFHMLAKVHGYIGNREASLNAFSKSLHLDPNNIRSLYEQALLMFKNGEKVESCEIFEKAALIEPAISKLPIKIEACGI